MLFVQDIFHSELCFIQDLYNCSTVHSELCFIKDLYNCSTVHSELCFIQDLYNCSTVHSDLCFIQDLYNCSTVHSELCFIQDLYNCSTVHSELCFIQDLYNWLEVDFNPLSLCKKVDDKLKVKHFMIFRLIYQTDHELQRNINWVVLQELGKFLDISVMDYLYKHTASKIQENIQSKILDCDLFFKFF